MNGILAWSLTTEVEALSREVSSMGAKLDDRWLVVENAMEHTWEHTHLDDSGRVRQEDEGANN